MLKRNFIKSGIVTVAAVAAISAASVAMSGSAGRLTEMVQVARPALQLVAALAGSDAGSFAQAILIDKPIMKPNPPGPRPPPR